MLRATMMRMGKGYLAFILALGLVLGLNACARSGPPAPVIDRTGAYAEANVPRPQKGKVAERAQPRSAPSRVRPTPPIPVTKAPLKAPSQTAASRETRTRSRDIRVKRGETLYAISRRHGVPLRALIDANSLAPPYRLAAGIRLRIPAVRVYRVGQGDTVYGIARRYDLNPGRIIRENRLKTADYRLYPGQKLILPQKSVARRPVPSPSIVPAVQRKSTPAAQAPRRRVALASPPDRPAPPPRNKRFELPPRAGSFYWPIRGKVLSSYGAKGGGLYNDGINIAARDGTPVRAAESGVVAYAGNELRGYGNLLLIRHSGGWVSAYAHNRKILVAKGQVVRRGQTIARVGRSGGVNTPQLHFELRRGPHAVDPMRYLGKNS